MSEMPKPESSAYLMMSIPKENNESQGQVITPMEWTKIHDTLLFREVLVINPFQAKKKTTQRAQLWQEIADNLKKMEEPRFKETLSKRSVQDRCTLLCDKYKKRTSYEKKASGTSPELTELDVLIEETIEKEEVNEEIRVTQSDEQKRKTVEERMNAVDVRKKAMEGLGETNKKKADEGDAAEKKRKPRRSGSDTLEFLREQTACELMMREKALEIEKEKQAREEQKHSDWKEMMAQQMAQQQQQQTQFQMMMMQQNNLLLSMIEKLLSNK